MLDPTTLKYATNWRVFAIYISVMTIATVVGDLQLSGAVPLRIGVSVVAGLIAASAFAGVRLIQHNKVSIVLTFTVVGVARGTTIGLLSQFLGLVDEVNWQFRIVGGAMTSGVGLLVSAMVISRVLDFRENFDRLVNLNSEINIATTDLASKLSGLRAKVREQVRNALDSAMHEISNARPTSISAVEYSRFANRIVNVSQLIVRPLSREIAQLQIQYEQRPTIRSLMSAVWRRIGEPLPAVPLVYPVWWFSLWAVVSASTMTAFLDPPQSGVAWISGLIALAAQSGGGLLIFRERVRRLNGGFVLIILACWFIASSIAVSFVPLVVVDGLWGSDHSALAEKLVLTDVVLMPISGVLFALITRIDALRSKQLDEFHSLLVQRQNAQAVINGELETLRRRVANQLHGEVQGTLVSIAMKINRFAAADGVDPFDWARLESDIVESFESVLRNGFDDSWAIVRERITRHWDGLVSITWALEPRIVENLDTDQRTREVVAGVIHDLVNNAVIHGEAQHIEVSLKLTEHSRIVLSVAHDGSAPSDGAKPGRGWTNLQTVAIAVSQRRINGRFEIVATIPMGTP